MSLNINEVRIAGRLGKDPELRYTANQVAVCVVSVATSSRYRDKQSGEWKDRPTEWHRVVLYRQHAEFAAQRLKAGSQVYVEGELRTRKWQDNDGAEKQITEIHASRFQTPDKLEGREGTMQPQQSTQSGQRTAPQGAGHYDEDDGIPF